jgi:uncharacterized protein
MRLAILSDIHDHVLNLRAALPACSDADRMIVCGDLCSPFIVNRLVEGFPRRIHIVFGNNDGDQFRMTQKAAEFKDQVTIHGEFADLTEEQVGIATGVNHYPSLAEGMAARGKYGLVCYGHDHTRDIRRAASGALLLNPGTLMGYDPTGMGTDIVATFCIVETAPLRVHVYSVDARRKPAVLLDETVTP